MRFALLVIIALICGCATKSDTDSAGAQAVDNCMDRAGSEMFWASHFTKPFEGEVNAIDPTGTSVLVSAAINGRLGKVESAYGISRLVIKTSGGESLINFAQIKNVVDSLGYRATGALGAISQIRNHRKVMAISTDLSYNLLLISGVENDVVYTIYPSGQVCSMSFDLFKSEFRGQPMLLINAVSI